MIQILIGLRQGAIFTVFAGIIYTAYLVCFTAEAGGVLPFLILSIGPFLGLAVGWWVKAQEEEVDEDEEERS